MEAFRLNNYADSLGLYVNTTYETVQSEIVPIDGKEESKMEFDSGALEFGNELIEWAENMFQDFPAGARWKPEGTGLTYRKMTLERSLLLVQMIDSEEARSNHRKLKALMAEVGVSMLDEEYNLVGAVGLEKAWPELIGQVGGERGSRTRGVWSYKTTDARTGGRISVDPEDYLLLMGDELYMRFQTSQRRYYAMTRDEMAESIDRGDNESGQAVVIGTQIDGEMVPPWMWGTYCWVEYIDDCLSDNFQDMAMSAIPGIEVV